MRHRQTNTDRPCTCSLSNSVCLQPIHVLLTDNCMTTKQPCHPCRCCHPCNQLLLRWRQPYMCRFSRVWVMSEQTTHKLVGSRSQGCSCVNLGRHSTKEDSRDCQQLCCSCMSTAAAATNNMRTCLHNQPNHHANNDTKTMATYKPPTEAVCQQRLYVVRGLQNIATKIHQGGWHALGKPP